MLYFWFTFPLSPLELQYGALLEGCGGELPSLSACAPHPPHLDKATRRQQKDARAQQDKIAQVNIHLHGICFVFLFFCILFIYMVIVFIVLSLCSITSTLHTYSVTFITFYPSCILCTYLVSLSYQFTLLNICT